MGEVIFRHLAAIDVAAAVEACVDTCIDACVIACVDADKACVEDADVATDSVGFKVNVGESSRGLDGHGAGKDGQEVNKD